MYPCFFVKGRAFLLAKFRSNTHFPSKIILKSIAFMTMYLQFKLRWQYCNYVQCSV